jgi:hypothetical protein
MKFCFGGGGGICIGKLHVRCIVGHSSHFQGARFLLSPCVHHAHRKKGDNWMGKILSGKKKERGLKSQKFTFTSLCKHETSNHS